MSVLTLSSLAFNVDVSIDKIDIQKNDEVILKIKASENVIATNFNINYDSTVFDLVDFLTSGLAVAEKNGKIACIYADINGVGTDELQIKFKVKSEIPD